MHEQAIGAADSSGQHQVGGTVAQPVAAELDRVQSRSAGGVEREAASGQAEGTRGEMRRQTRGEPVTRIGASRRLARSPDLLGEGDEADGRVGQIAQHEPGARQRPGGAASLLQCLPGRVQDPPVQRVQPHDLLGVDREAQWIEGCVEIPDEPAARREAAPAGRDVRPEGVRVECVRHDATATDDRDWFLPHRQHRLRSRGCTGCGCLSRDGALVARRAVPATATRRRRSGRHRTPRSSRRPAGPRPRIASHRRRRQGGTPGIR